MKTTYSAKVLAFLTLLSSVGFWKSFYFASAETRSEYPWIVYAHGITLLAWGVLATLQAQLIGRRRLKFHRWLGWCSTGLVAAAVASTVAVVRWSVARNLEDGSRANVLGFTLVQTTDLVTFVSFFVAALVKRQRKADHLSWVIAATIALLAPSLVRAKIQWLEFVPVNPVTFAILCMNFTLFALWLGADGRNRGSRKVFGLALAWLATVQLLRPHVSTTQTWLTLAEKIFTR